MASEWERGVRLVDMPLRDYFAAQAMAALIPLGIDGTVDDFGPTEVAHDAYAFADAMLKARDE